MAEEAIWPVETLEDEVALLVIIGPIIVAFEGVWLLEPMPTEAETTEVLFVVSLSTGIDKWTSLCTDPISLVM